MIDDLQAETIRISGHGNDQIEAYLAQPLDEGPFGGVVVIHHSSGLDEGTKEIARKFAAHGYLALCPNLYWREAPGAGSDDAAAIARAQGGVPNEQALGDMKGAVAHLKSLASSNGKIGTIGYCSGGRQSFLAACSLALDAAVVCYGAFIAATAPEELLMPSASPLLHLTKDLSCPILGLFGKEDKFPSPVEVAEIERELEAQRKTYEFHIYEDAGHSFFSTDRPGYRPEAANAGWQSIWGFFTRYLNA